MVRVHSRIFDRHPELSEDDVQTAWDNQVASAMRPEAPNYPVIVAIGYDGQGRMVEMVATMQADGWLVYHAFTPPTKRVLDEIFPNRR